MRPFFTPVGGLFHLGQVFELRDDGGRSLAIGILLDEVHDGALHLSCQGGLLLLIELHGSLLSLLGHYLVGFLHHGAGLVGDSLHGEVGLVILLIELRAVDVVAILHVAVQLHGLTGNDDQLQLYGVDLALLAEHAGRKEIHACDFIGGEVELKSTVFHDNGLRIAHGLASECQQCVGDILQITFHMNISVGGATDLSCCHESQT